MTLQDEAFRFEGRLVPEQKRHRSENNAVFTSKHAIGLKERHRPWQERLLPGRPHPPENTARIAQLLQAATAC